VVQSLPRSIFFYNSLMPTIRVTIVSPSSGFYNFLFADANNDSIRKLEQLPSLSAAEIVAMLQGPFPLQKFLPVDEATYQRLFAE
jgi:hypothetical protein